MLVAEEAVEIRVLKRQGKEHSRDRADARVGARATTTDANALAGTDSLCPPERSDTDAARLLTLYAPAIEGRSVLIRRRKVG
jgi:hypothetical protein